jgi:hypothetical protein
MINRSSVASPLASYLALPVGRNRNAAYSQHEESHFQPEPSKDDLKELKEMVKSGEIKDFGIANIAQAGHEFVPIPPRGSRRRRLPDSPGPTEKIGYARDWLHDEELSDHLRKGYFGATKATHTSKRARANSDDEPERMPKRRMFQAETSGTVVEDTTMHPRIVKSFSHDKLRETTSRTMSSKPSPN